MAEDAAIQGLSAYAWARRAGLADTTVSRFLSGKSRRTNHVFSRLCVALGHPPAHYLLRPEPAPEPARAEAGE